MQTHPRGMQRWLILGILLLALTACATRGTRGPLEDSTALSGSWNDTDSRSTAEALIKDALVRPWTRRFAQVTGRKPVVTVGTVMNRTHEDLNTQTFIKDLQQALMHSGQVQLVAGAGQRLEVRQERLDQAQNTRPDTVKPSGQELGADFMLRGSINILMDERDGTKAVLYQVDLELVDIASNVQVWLGQKHIKKLVERSKTTL